VFLPQLRRVRWAVRATLVLGVAASVVANVLHAQENPISQAIAAWPPLALLLTVELISRVPVHRKSLAVARLLATATIAGIAAWVSYWHMAGVAAKYGETGASPYLLPLSVDGLIVVASICLVELGGRISTVDAETAARAAAAEPASRTASASARRAPAKPDPAAASASAPAPNQASAPASNQAAARRSGASKAASAKAAPGAAAVTAPAPKQRRTAAETIALMTRIKAEKPETTDAELAAQLGISIARLRTVRRAAQQTPQDVTTEQAAPAKDLRLAA
jgi:hypothetical protein